MTKRKRPGGGSQTSNKRHKTQHATNLPPSTPLLRKYYPQVVTLRQYLASRLSKKRRKRVQQYGSRGDQAHLCDLLDSTLIGTFKPVQVDDGTFEEQDLNLFTQQLSHADPTASVTPGDLNQSEIVDFVIWLLFRRSIGTLRPKHILCQYFQRYVTETVDGVDPEIVPGIPGVYSVGPNEHVRTLRRSPWTEVPDLLGKGAERIVSDLLMDCGIFTPVAGSSNLLQLSGIPMCDLTILDDSTSTNGTSSPDQFNKDNTKRGLVDIRFVRHRMLYARATMNARGGIHYGLTPVHILNRCRDLDSRDETAHIMMYVFPAQFGLHNVLRSAVTANDSADPFKDYTLREHEINQQEKRRLRKNKSSHFTSSAGQASLPKRLRGTLEALIRRLRKRHFRCPYHALLQHYCADQNTAKHSQGASTRRAANACDVSAFCRAAVSRVFPHELWGEHETGIRNSQILYSNIDRFIRLRRFESISLHEVLQGMKLHNVGWLTPPQTDRQHSLSKTDYVKRRELMAELLYYVFDSFLMPLIRAHFHVTESSSHRNQLFYFRHDVWKAMAEPALGSIKQTMLEECKPAAVKEMLAKRSLGVSNVRMLPKEHGMRPIINLRRRVQKLQRGKLVLGRSINSLMTPAFSVLNYEKSANPDLLGSALFSVDDIFPRLQSYRKSLNQNGLRGRPLYFAKVDVQACFDTIPQERLLRLMNNVITADQYQVAKMSRAKLAGSHGKETPGFGAKPSWKFLTKAVAGHDLFDFLDEVRSDMTKGRTRSVYINGGHQRRGSRHDILSLLEEHVQANLIRIGKQFYRQRTGIPQGSIVSSILCSYFYAELEREYLGFLNDDKSLLLRLIDDFLVISTERSVVEKFMSTMHRGIPEFGVEVKAEKSRVNFDMEIEGRSVCKLTDGVFPYCGNAIHMTTLDMTKDEERRRNNNLADSVTVEYSKIPGQSFYRKTLNALKLQMHAMLLSTSYNSIETVLSNLYQSFLEVAQKSYHYVKSMPPTQHPTGKLMIKAVDDTIKLACVLMRHRKQRDQDAVQYECCVSNTQARWLACNAFLAVFHRRQTKHGVLLTYVEQQLLGLQVPPADRRLLETAVANKESWWVSQRD